MSYADAMPADKLSLWGERMPQASGKRVGNGLQEAERLLKTALDLLDASGAPPEVGAYVEMALDEIRKMSSRDTGKK